MPRLLLLRHAKSAWDDPGLSDFDRPLNARGRRAAPLMGRHMAEHALSPDLVLCSTARRTRETFACLLPFLAHDMTVRFTRALYDTTDRDYLDVLRREGGQTRTLLLIGHNPALQALAVALVGSGNPALMAEIGATYPTAGLTIIDFPERGWADIRPEGGRIVAFFRPRELEAVGTEVRERDD